MIKLSDITAYRKFLNTSYFFNALTEDEVESVLNVCTEETYAPDTVIFQIGDIADKVYIIYKGTVAVTRTDDEEYLEFEPVYGPGNIFGEMSLIDGMPRGATITVKTACTCLVISREDFQWLLNTSSHIALAIMKSITLVVRRNDSILIDILKKHNQKLAEDNLEIKTTQETRLRNERLSTLGRFASSIIHDIRNPLAVIRGYSELITCDTRVQSTVKEKAEKIIQLVDRLSSLSAGILEYARGNLQLNYSRVNIREYFIRCIDEMLERFSGRRMEIRYEVKTDGDMDIDSERFTRVVYNLLENGYKAMPEGGTFLIAAETKENNIFFHFKDSGIGITAEEQKKIFEPFYSGSNSTSIGLGLSIVKSIVEAHGGSVSLHSERGKGSTFTLVFPRFRS